MIMLRRLHVVNWMYYGICTVDFEKSNLLAGPTGSGKSSLVDALQVLMLGEIGSRYFNRSATGGKSDRTIVTYLRGRYSENVYKRADKGFSSYIVIDFYDKLNNEEFCYGVVFDLAEDNAHEKDYFYIGKKFLLDWALKESNGKTSARSRRELKALLKDRGVSAKIFAPVDFRNDLLIRLGIYDQHFFHAFRTAVAYVPLDKIEKFIVQNICHMENEIDVMRMKSAINEYQRMQRDMEDFQERRKKLVEIKGIYDDFSSKRETYSTQEYIVERAQVDRLREEQLKAESEMSRIEDEREILASEEERLENSRKEKESRGQELLILIKEDPERIRKEDLNNKLNECNQKIKDRENKRDKQLLLLGQRLAAWRRRIEEAIEHPLRDEFGRLSLAELSQNLGLFSQYTKESFPNLETNSLSELNWGLEKLRNTALILQTGFKKSRDESKQRIEEYRHQLAELRKGIKNYPKDLLELRNHLQKSLSIAYNDKAHVYILADLISITDVAWVNAIEGYIRRQKLYLLTEPNHYREAVRIFKEFSRDNQIYLYRLVNTESILTDKSGVLDTSLSKIIETEHLAARKYIDYLLGRVERADSIEDVGGKRTALTVDGMLYKGYTVARINEEFWRMKHIGRDSIERQIEEIERLLELELIQQESRNAMVLSLQPISDEKPMNDEFIDNIEQAVIGSRELPDLNNECDELWKQLQTIDDSYSKQLEDEQGQIRIEITSIQNELDGINKGFGKLEEQHHLNFAISEEKEEAWEKAQQHFSVIYPEGNDVALRTSMRYERELTLKGSAEKLQQDFEKGLSTTKGRIESLKHIFERKTMEYNFKHTSSAVSTDISDGEWRKAYSEVISVEVESYTEKVVTARKRAEEIFHNEFINQIKRNIDSVRREIKLLNNALDEYTFGKTRYRFKCVPTENPEMRKYYDMITNIRLDGASLYDLVEPGAVRYIDLS